MRRAADAPTYRSTYAPAYSPSDAARHAPAYSTGVSRSYRDARLHAYQPAYGCCYRSVAQLRCGR